MQVSRILPALALVIVACQPREHAPNEITEFTQADHDALVAINDSAMQYIMRGDWSKWAAFLTEDAIFQPANGRTVEGRVAIEAWARGLPPIDSVFTYDNRYHGSGDLAYMTSGYRARQNGVWGDSSKQLVVFRRLGGQWRVPAISISADTVRIAGTAGRGARR